MQNRLKMRSVTALKSMTEAARADTEDAADVDADALSPKIEFSSEIAALRSSATRSVGRDVSRPDRTVRRLAAALTMAS